MKLINNGNSFEIRYNHVDHTIPSGEMEVADNGFATFILNKARKWGLLVSKVSDTKVAAVEPIAPVKKLVEEVAEAAEVKEDVEKPTKKVR